MSKSAIVRYLTCQDEADLYGEWPNCSTPDCPAKVCFRFNNGKCWPCTVGMPANWAEGMPIEESEVMSRAIEKEYRLARALV